ncbi:MAG: mechanosensitive ion channel protein MscL [Candidatus Staskawiczbacteria bacterium RIFOXYB2_FULL_32_9]|uniref:Large-conductance mechanosensitive channel n=1 Tax=Candidatus Staskawiczbacteria bacterium RIFOXYD1_FULL_32_13 TaxID=1802234 RepID=A0A1G2JRE7_9BACT|nr:MAG: Large conductance mechanosensitive channel protein [Parcubacteria group bacterium GW2011_GWC2_32_10]OGZ84234.1 MAG: mechanosensitive ion channel protein MscL [Candidatus Staskawiczbacteria bacterium RIFOXYB2_FULL_32_9]OGZ87925.1 MAG: mechanosensitive ion channel protein MscL [Candidatus Staskawiczbacteria bacterium RIFOXYC2_FULL_32_10]OGZ89727.1 MAG: mechanosensitive ion channel protein MscL [Candidatus Staskawiczbacteria bacterium RIFOXYD1_FULL_32_13]
MNKVFEGFRDFVMRGNAVDLAVGVVIGVSFGAVINSLVKGLLTPLIGAIAKVPDFSGLYFTLNGSKFLYGEFVNAIVAFLLVAFAIYFFVVLPMNVLTKKMKKKELSSPTTKKCKECLSEIPLEAKRCSYCTQIVQ